MPFANVTRLRRVQAGIESTRGTAATVTRRVYGTIVRSHTQAIEEIPDESGTFWGGDAVVAGDAEVGFSVDAVATYEDLPWWLLLALDGTQTPAADAGTPIAYTYTAAPNGETDDLKTATFEAGVPGLVYRSPMVGCRRLTIGVNRADARFWRITADLFAQRVDKIADFTAAIPQRTRETILAAATQLFIDNAGGSLGTTEILNKWRSFSLTIDNNPDFKRFGNSDAFVAADFGRGQQVVTGELVLEHTDDAEYEKQRLLAARRIRVRKAGSVIHDAVTRRATIDVGNAYLNAPAENTVGNNIVQSFGFVAKPLAGAAPVSIEVVSALATLP